MRMVWELKAQEPHGLLTLRQDHRQGLRPWRCHPERPWFEYLSINKAHRYNAMSPPHRTCPRPNRRAGVQNHAVRPWIPACAGMTSRWPCSRFHSV